MNTIARTVIATALAAPVLAAPADATDSILRVRASDASDFVRFLPAVPTNVPWLAADGTLPKRTVAMPEAGSIAALMFVPVPAKAWSPFPSQAADRSFFAGM